MTKIKIEVQLNSVEEIKHAVEVCREVAKDHPCEVINIRVNGPLKKERFSNAAEINDLSSWA